MPIATNSTGQEFVYNNLQSVLASNEPNGTNPMGATPYVINLERLVAQQVCSRQPGGVAFALNGAGAGPNSTTAAIMLSGMETNRSRLPYTKNGAFICVTTGTTAVSVTLLNTATNTNSQCGDTVFAKWNQITLYNLSGVDGVNSASMTLGTNTNGANFGWGTNGVITLQGSSRWELENVNGGVVNGVNATITITPTAGGTFAMVVSGS